MTLLTVTNLVKRYGKNTAVNAVSFSVKKGQVFGLLGPNGSGKTTLLGCITGILLPDSGSFNWFGDSEKDRSREKIGSMIETPNFYPYLSAAKNLEIIAAIKGKGKERIEQTLKEVDLLNHKNAAFKTFSLGMKQRLAIGAALLTNPEVLLLDEPTNGLDPQGINEMRQLIIRQRDQGKTIILASHLLNEVEKVCTDVVILKKGNVLKTSTVAALLGNENSVEVGADDTNKLQSALTRTANITFDVQADKRFIVQLPDDLSAQWLNRKLLDDGIEINHLLQLHSNLESEFLKLIGGQQ